MFWKHLESLIYVTLIFETKQHALFSKLKKKKKWKTVKFEFQIFILTPRLIFFAPGQNFLNDMIMNGVKENIPRLWTKFTLKKKPLLNSKEFSKFNVD